MDYICCNNYTDKISTHQFFPKNYYNKYIKKYINNENLIYSLEDNYSDLLIFITKVELLQEFYNKIVLFIKKKFILITHYSDKYVGNFKKIINHPMLIKWYGINMKIISNKTSAIPIGLESVHFGRTNFDIIKIHENNIKDKLLYLNFSLKTHRNRKNIMNNLIKKGFKQNEKKKWEDYIEDLSKHKFCISPRGNGVDCHRHWECLYLGVIPIIEKSPEMKDFEDLPILYVDNYNEINVEYLNQIYEEFQKKKFNMEKLNLMYWNNKIKRHFIDDFYN